MRDHDGQSDTPDIPIQKYGLTFANFVNPEYRRENGAAREGITEMFRFAVDNDLSFSMVAPTARYVEMAVAAEADAAAIAAAAQTAAEEMEIFLTRLFDGSFGRIPRNFTIELGSEYFDTAIWKSETAAADTDGDGIPDPMTGDPGNLPKIFGAVFAAMAAKVNNIERLNGHTLMIEGTAYPTDINVAVQMSRFQEDADDDLHRGDYFDNADFIDAFEAFGQDALDAVDSVIWHRYVTRWGGIENGIWDPVRRDETGVPVTVSDVVAKWEEAAGREIDLVAGFSSPTLSNEKHKLEHGEQSLGYILQQTTGLMAEGADFGSLYGIGSGQFGSYAYRDNVFIGGDLWGLMAESLPGKYVVETFHGDGSGYRTNTSPLVYDSSGNATGNRNDESVNSYVFENDDEVVIFLVAKDFGTPGNHRREKLDYRLHFDVDVAFGNTVHLWDSGSDYVSGSGRQLGSFGQRSDTAVPVDDTDNGALVSVRFNHDYELIRLTLDKVLYGSTADDRLNGYETADSMVGLAGDDLLLGRGGDDTLKGGQGDDSMIGGEGTDVFIGGDGTDLVDYSDAAGPVRVNLSKPGKNAGVAEGETHSSVEWFIGTQTGDSLSGNGTRNGFVGGAGNDTLKGGGSHDTLRGGDGDDVLVGDGGRDTLNGGSGGDRLSGRGGKDYLTGLDGDDTLNGGSGADTLTGGAGSDILNGGRNPDVFVFADGHGQDTIQSFKARNDAEKIDLTAVTALDGLDDLLLGGAARQAGLNVVINTGGGNSILLRNVLIGELDDKDFLF